MQYPDFSKPFNLTTDASNVALGAVLSQGPPGRDLPIAYASRTLNDSEQNYSTIEKECLCLVWATKYFRPYLFGRKFNIITDHKPSQWLFSLKDPSSKLLRSRIKLEEYDYKILYKKGTSNTNADALSRIEIHAKEDEPFSLKSYMEEFNKQLERETEQASTSAQRPTSPRLSTSNSQEIDQASMLVQIDNHQSEFDTNDERQDNQNDEQDNDTIHTNNDQDPIVGIPIADIPVNYGANQVIRSQTLHSPVNPKLSIIFEKKRSLVVQLSKSNFENDVLKLIKENIVPGKQYHLYFEEPGVYKQFCEVVRKYFRWPSLNLKRCLKKLLDVTNKSDIEEIIQNYHCGKTNHRGIDETLFKIKERYYWPKQKDSVQTYINHEM